MREVCRKDEAGVSRNRTPDGRRCRRKKLLRRTNLYSPKRDSCLCVLGNKLKQPNGEDAYSILIIDALTKKLLFAKEYRSGGVTGMAGDVAGMADDIEVLVKRYE